MEIMVEFKTFMFIVVTVLSLVLFWGGVVYVFSGCSVKILTFGTENESVDKEYFIGTRKGE